MLHAKRDRDGNIVALHAKRDGDAKEQVLASDPDVVRFLANDRTGKHSEALLSASDQELVRVVEDLIVTLVDKGVIMYTDLPPAAQRKLAQRRRVREGLQNEPPIMVKKNNIL